MRNVGELAVLGVLASNRWVTSARIIVGERWERGEVAIPKAPVSYG